MKKLIFGLDDFAEMLWDGKPLTIERIARIAQAKHDAFMKELIGDAIVVYHDKELDDVWTTMRHGEDTHTALLINVKEIEKKPCEHRPLTLVGVSKHFIDSTVWTAPIAYQCQHCGVELVANWVAK